MRLGDREVLRGIYVAVRDRNWGTVAPELSDLQIERGDGTFRVTFAAAAGRRRSTSNGAARSPARRTATVDYRMDGIARSTFLRNRIGFCVLHDSAACAGAACTIEHVDGSSRQTSFPQDIAPHQPFQDVRAISHQVLPGVTARVLLEGDTFETEDQRNWTDASFKTYCTPLALPFPAEIAQGTRVRQSVSLRLSTRRRKRIRSRTALPGRQESPVLLRCGPACRLPRIGLGVASHGKPLSPQAQSRLSLLRLDHLRVSLDMKDGRIEQRLQAAAAEARQIGAALHVAATLRRRNGGVVRAIGRSGSDSGAGHCGLAHP